MIRRTLHPTAVIPACFLAASVALAALAAQAGRGESSQVKSAETQADFAIQSLDSKNQTVVLVDPSTRKPVTIEQRQNYGPWTLMGVVEQPQGDLAVFENLQDRKGSIVYAGKQGVVVVLPKSLEPTSVPANTLYRGRTVDEVANSKIDFLGQELLAGDGDPDYDEVAAALPPLRVPSFVGTRHSADKPTFDYAGFSDEIYVDVGKLFSEIREAREKRDVWEGLVGGWLPVNRFVFPAGDERYWEETMFAEEGPGNFWTQPVWFRVLLVEGGRLKEAHYYYHHLPFPPRGEPPAALFYKGLLDVHTVWKRELDPPMKIDVPDQRILDFSLHGLLLEQITRVGDHPKYGYPPLGGIDVFGGYGYNNVDTFQDVFTTSVEAFLEWGMFDVAARYIDDYFTHSVRDDGSIDTRGPEIGQYGKMLKVVAKYYAYSKDAQLLRKHEKKIEAIVNLFRMLRKEAKQVPPSDITYGIVRGWSEHDSGLKIDPYRFMLPHYSNNAEAARGFRDLGEVWIEMGRKLPDARLEEVGRGLLKESAAMNEDMIASMEKSVDRSQDPPYMPAVAGDTPTYGKMRAYLEALESGELTNEHVRIIIDNLAANGGSRFGLPGRGMYLNGFLVFGAALARLQLDLPREFLLLYYAHMAHIYSRGTWTSVEGAKIDGTLTGPYCTPAQVTIPTFTKWMLVFEDPHEPVVWLAKATPRVWLEQGKKIAVANAPTRFGSVGYEVRSDIANGRVSGVVHMPEGSKAAVKLRCRVPGGKRMHAVTLNGAPWTDFSADQELVTIPASYSGTIRLEITY